MLWSTGHWGVELGSEVNIIDLVQDCSISSVVALCFPIFSDTSAWDITKVSEFLKMYSYKTVFDISMFSDGPKVMMTRKDRFRTLTLYSQSLFEDAYKYICLNIFASATEVLERHIFITVDRATGWTRQLFENALGVNATIHAGVLWVIW